MDTTSPSLLIRLRSAADSAAWSRFVDLYTPLIYYWARKAGLQSQDASDLVQEVLALLVQKLPEFRYDESRSFRGWLRVVTLNKWRQWHRRKVVALADATQPSIDEIADPNTEYWDHEYPGQLVSRMMDLIQPQFDPKTWRALQEYITSTALARDVAERNGVSVWTIYSAKSRLLRHLRRELDGLLE